MMKKNGVAFHELRDLLLELGFSERLERKRIRFVHPTTESFFLFRPYNSRESVHIRDLLVVQRQLVDDGLIDSSAFDRFLQQASA